MHPWAPLTIVDDSLPNVAEQPVHMPPMTAEPGLGVPATSPEQPVHMPPMTAEPRPDSLPVSELREVLAEEPVADQPFPQDVRRPTALSSGALPITAWIVSLILLALLVDAAYIWRAQIMAAWPPSERLYAALGLAHPAKDAAPPTTKR